MYRALQDYWVLLQKTLHNFNLIIINYVYGVGSGRVYKYMITTAETLQGVERRFVKYLSKILLYSVLYHQ